MNFKERIKASKDQEAYRNEIAREVVELLASKDITAFDVMLVIEDVQNMVRHRLKFC